MHNDGWQRDFEFGQDEVEELAQRILDVAEDERGPLVVAALAYVLEVMTEAAIASGHDRSSANCNVGRILEVGIRIREDGRNDALKGGTTH